MASLDNLTFDVNTLIGQPAFNWDAVSAIDNIEASTNKIVNDMVANNVGKVKAISGKLATIGANSTTNSQSKLGSIQANVNSLVDTSVANASAALVPLASTYGNPTSGNSWYVVFRPSDCNEYWAFLEQWASPPINAPYFGPYDDPVRLAYTFLNTLGTPGPRTHDGITGVGGSQPIDKATFDENYQYTVEHPDYGFNSFNPLTTSGVLGVNEALANVVIPCGGGPTSPPKPPPPPTICDPELQAFLTSHTFTFESAGTNGIGQTEDWYKITAGPDQIGATFSCQALNEMLATCGMTLNDCGQPPEGPPPTEPPPDEPPSYQPPPTTTTGCPPPVINVEPCQPTNPPIDLSSLETCCQNIVDAIKSLKDDSTDSPEGEPPPASSVDCRQDNALAYELSDCFDTDFAAYLESNAITPLNDIGVDKLGDFVPSVQKLLANTDWSLNQEEL